MMPKLTSVKHELVVLTKATYWQNKIRRREIKANKRANFRCVYCRKQGRKDLFTKWVCVGCAFLPLCKNKTKRTVNKQDSFRKYHDEMKIDLLLGQKEIASTVEMTLLCSVALLFLETEYCCMWTCLVLFTNKVNM